MIKSEPTSKCTLRFARGGIIAWSATGVLLLADIAQIFARTLIAGN